MGTVRFTLDPAHPPAVSAETQARMAAMTPEEIEANAAGDPDNPPLTEEEFARMDAARLARAARKVVGLSQARFAAAFRISPGRLRDLEQGRYASRDRALLAYLTVIEREPDAVRRALAGDG